VTYIGTSLGFHNLAFWSASVLALLLGVSKRPVVSLLLQREDISTAFHRSGNRFLLDNVGLSCFVSTVSLAAWLAIIEPFVTNNQVFSLKNFLTIVLPFVAGLVI
jgi:hypothetical protein